MAITIGSKHSAPGKTPSHIVRRSYIANSSKLR